MHDFEKLQHQELLFICFMVKERTEEQLGRPLRPFNPEDFQAAVETLNELGKTFKAVQKVKNSELFEQFISTCNGAFPPL